MNNAWLKIFGSFALSNQFEKNCSQIDFDSCTILKKEDSFAQQFYI